jgi:hypothetical protein
MGIMYSVIYLEQYKIHIIQRRDHFEEILTTKIPTADFP